MIRLSPFVLLDASSKGRLQQFKKKFFLYFYVTFGPFLRLNGQRNKIIHFKEKRYG